MDDSVAMLAHGIVSGYIIISDQISIESTGDGEIFSGYLNVVMRCSNFQLHGLLDSHLQTKTEFCLNLGSSEGDAAWYTPQATMHFVLLQLQ